MKIYLFVRVLMEYFQFNCFIFCDDYTVIRQQHSPRVVNGILFELTFTARLTINLN